MAKTNKIVAAALRAKLEKLMLEGNFPEVGYKKTEYGHEYMALEYSMVHSRAAKVVDFDLKKRGIPDGIFANKRSQAFTDRVNECMFALTPERIKAEPERFRTMFD